MEARECPACSQTLHSSGWQGPGRLRCECGQPLNLAEAQLDPHLIDECREIADELKDDLAPRRD